MPAPALNLPTVYVVKRPPAFTLVEMLAVMAIIALLLVAAVPAFQGFSQAQSRRGAVSSVMGVLDHARMMAITDGKAAYVVFASKVPGGAQVSASYWGRAYAIYEDSDNVSFQPVQRTPWQFLPTGAAFKVTDAVPPAAPAPSILTCYRANAPQSGDPAFPISGAAGSAPVSLPYWKFDATGSVSVPLAVPAGSEADYLRLLVFPGVVTAAGAEVFTGGGPTAQPGAQLEEVDLVQATGRARYNADPLNNLTPTPAP